MSGAVRMVPKVLPTVLADIRHGSHLCAFYETKDDLTDLVLPYFEAGAKRGDLCLWMMPDHVGKEEALAWAGKALVDRGIELFPGRGFYRQGGRFTFEPIKSFWNQKLEESLATGYAGMRASGDAFWLQRGDWKAFMEYETDLNGVIAGRPLALLCTYPLSVSTAGDILEVAHAHQFAIAKRKRTWEVIKGWGISEAPVGAGLKGAEALDAASRIASLSPRERQVLRGIMTGQYNKVIAHDLNISVRTVEVLRARMLNRLGVRTAAEAVRLGTLASLFACPQ